MLRRPGNINNINIDTSVQKPSRCCMAGQMKNIPHIKGCERNRMSDLTEKVKGRILLHTENHAVVSSASIDESLHRLTPQNIEGGQL